jgi:argininosuccinate lyase
LEKHVELGELSLDELRQFGSEFDEDFYAAVTLQATLDCHDVIGGTATNRVKAALRETASRVSALKRSHAPEVLHAGA